VLEAFLDQFEAPTGIGLSPGVHAEHLGTVQMIWRGKSKRSLQVSRHACVRGETGWPGPFRHPEDSCRRKVIASRALDLARSLEVTSQLGS